MVNFIPISSDIQHPVNPLIPAPNQANRVQEVGNQSLPHNLIPVPVRASEDPLSSSSYNFYPATRSPGNRKYFVPSIGEELIDWVEDPSVLGEKIIARERMLEAKYTLSKTLDLSNLGLTSLPDEFEGMKRLEIINLKGNHLTSFSKSIEKLLFLKKVILDEIIITRDFYERPPRRTYIYTKLTQIGTIFAEKLMDWVKKDPSVLGDKIEARRRILQSRYNWEYQLDLSNLGLTSLPDCFPYYYTLWNLDVCNNQLSALPDSLMKLNGLHVLNLSSNNFHFLSPDLGKHSELEKLILDHNHLSALPDSYGKLQDLKNLCLDNNEFFSFPEVILKLSQLQKLTIHHNQLSSLPENIENLSELTSLEIHHNPGLKDLPVSLEKIPEIFDLDIDGTQIPFSTLFSIFDKKDPLMDSNITEEKKIAIFENSLENWAKSTPRNSLKILGKEWMTCSHAERIIKDRLKKAFINKCQVLNLDLRCSHSNLHYSIPDCIKNISNLTELRINWIPLYKIPNSIGKLSNLKILVLSGSFDFFPKIITTLQNLEKITLKGNIANIPNQIENLSRLKFLDFSSNKLVSLPDEIGTLSNLQELRLDSNQLASFPESIGRLANLNFLSLSNNKLSHIPLSIGNLTNLTTLLLQGNNELQDLPVSLGNLLKITNENFNDTKIPKRIRYSILKLRNLNRETLLSEEERKENFEHKILDWTNRSTQNSRFSEEIRKAYLTNSTSLALFSDFFTTLTEIPENIGSLIHLERLYSHCKLISLPESIGYLPNLRVLSLDHNDLSTLPESMEILSSLEELDLSFNHIIRLPKWIWGLENLHNLDLSSNPLIALPNNPGILNSQLKRLTVNGTEIENLPDSIGNLSRLEELTLNNNVMLSSLPTSLGNLSHLSYFDISNNPRLSTLPISLGDIPTLNTLRIEGTNIPQDTATSILNQCQSIRRIQGEEALLASRVQSWETFAKVVEDRNYGLDFIKNLDNRKKGTLSLWLKRLSFTDDFKYQQNKLAHIVCSILETLRDNEKFRELFFPQAEGDFENCMDRAAQSLNETYTSWKLHTIDSNATLKEKLQLLAGLAKTGELRDTIKKIIVKKNKDYLEQVEVVLYFEIHLKEALGLVSAITHSHYSPPPETLNWFDIKELKKQVNENYKTSLVRSSAFLELAMEDQHFATEKEKIEKDYADKMSQIDLDKDQSSINEGQYLLATKALQEEKQITLDTLSIEWFTRQLGE